MNRTKSPARGRSALAVVMWLSVGAVRAHAALPSGAASAAGAEAVAPATPRVAQVFFAQHHVLPPDDPLFKLVGNLEALIKVQVYAGTPTPAPQAFAILELESRRLELPLRGPRLLPPPPVGEPKLMPHSFGDSFTARIPKEWVKPGLAIAVELRAYDYSNLELNNYDAANRSETEGVTVVDRVVFDDLRIGAPTRLVMTMFDIHYFGEAKEADYPEGWFEELKTKLPVAELELHRVRDVMFDELVMPPTGERAAIRCSSEADFKTQTGVDYDGEQAVALQWNSALKMAAGRHGLWRHYFTNICGVKSGGQAGGCAGVGNIARHGVLWHELGHTFGLPHWLHNKPYPYRGDMYGISAGDGDAPHAGPTWAFDLSREAFIPPTVQADSVGGIVGTWKKDPMHGGGQGDQGNAYMFRHYSDYSVSRIREFLENRVVYWDEASGQYAGWNQAKGAYANVCENDGMRFPIERDVEVISLLVSASGATPQANIIYPPIGPYPAGLIRLFDADSAADREAAVPFGYSGTQCNVALRVTQGGTVKSYLLPIAVSRGDDPVDRGSFHVSAINLPARAGAVTQVELLHAPALMAGGLAGEVEVLARWPRPSTASGGPGR